MTLPSDYTDKQLIYQALNMWANWIETGNVLHSAIRAKELREEDKINALNTDQMKLVVRLRELADGQMRPPCIRQPSDFRPGVF